MQYTYNHQKLHRFTAKESIMQMGRARIKSSLPVKSLGEKKSTYCIFCTKKVNDLKNQMQNKQCISFNVDIESRSQIESLPVKSLEVKKCTYTNDDVLMCTE